EFETLAARLITMEVKRTLPLLLLVVEGQLDLLLDELKTINTNTAGIREAGALVWHFSKMDTGSFSLEEKMIPTDRV
ncbi:hypothetical protein LSAT2_012737, partial [Lamellibrachia satsuma]